MGRPRTSAPRGRVTLQRTAEISGLSYQRVYTLVASGAVPSEREASGVYTVSRRDVKLIKRRPPADDKRRVVMLRRASSATRRGSVPRAGGQSARGSANSRIG